MTNANEDRWPDPEVVDLPRQQAGSSSQALLGALLADYTFEDAGGLTSEAVVRLLAEFGISSSGARSALSRIVKRGLLVPHRRGRTVTYDISDTARLTHRAKLGAVVRFGTPAPLWDGQWTVAVFSVPETQRILRQRLRTLLENGGFAMFADAVWVCPWDRRDHASRIGSDLGVHLALFRGEFFACGDSEMTPSRAFDLRAVRKEYDTFLDTHADEAAAIIRGQLTADRALVLRTTVLRDWRRIAALDPALPQQLLPMDWPQGEARQVFEVLWRGLGPLALARLRTLLADIDPAVAINVELMDIEVPQSGTSTTP
ncbi:PaaX family transcriptional regulator C-terminal domain-containing protein [Rhodococcus jostii]|uniref:Transcriptional regulator, PaaX family n=1 Tax=Rhodococcus jostii TaxID=132919 RepID=A0A1H5E6I2_RHOJO|nr:PaaX family transcriptional regulator C-terminal domain-containing protein [Rhodococcus jostii]SED86752.1 transcriptional regulator, PaaX family [Rhodococcus jostii]